MSDLSPSNRVYYAPHGGHPPQTELLTGRAIFTTAYAVIPKGVMCDIVTSYLPNWEKTRLWILARPMSGFAETFSQYIVEVAPGGGSTRPEPNDAVEAVLFVVEGQLTLTLDRRAHTMSPGGYAFIPPGSGLANAQSRRGIGPLPLDPQGLRTRRGNCSADCVWSSTRTTLYLRGCRTLERWLGDVPPSSMRRTCATICM